MKNNITKILALIVISAGYGCKKSEDFPVDKISIYYVFNPQDSAGTTAQAYLNNVYNTVKNGHNRVGGDYLDAASDDAISRNLSTASVTMLSTAGYTSATTIDNAWEESPSYWSGIRAANEFINNIGVVPVKGFLLNGVPNLTTGVPTNMVWKSEARFLRAWFYFELVRRYGGVPLMGDKVYTLNDNVAIPRSSFADCIKYIVSECDAVKDNLLAFPLTASDQNSSNYRVTKGAAMTLKARALLYAASPLFNGGNIDAANPLTGYTDFNADRWLQAATAAQDVINLGTYQLNTDYKDIFLTQNNVERIWIRPVGINSTIESNNGPIGATVSANANTCPTQELVNSFPMLNGADITAAGSGYNAADPYGTVAASAKRDPRLTFNILYNGAQWLNSTIQTYEGGANKPNINANQTVTGYYMRKFMGLQETATTSYNTHSADWVIFRYAEILLSFAEARNEVEPAPQADVYNQLYAIRKRAGITAGASSNYGIAAGLTKDQMRTLIQNEWRIEFPFEEHRFFDIRRWKTAKTVMNAPHTGVSIVKTGSTLTFNPITVLTTTFADKQYLYPVPYNEVAKNPNMKQNPGW